MIDSENDSEGCVFHHKPVLINRSPALLQSQTECKQLLDFELCVFLLFPFFFFCNIFSPDVLWTHGYSSLCIPESLLLILSAGHVVTVQFHDVSGHRWIAWLLMDELSKRLQVGRHNVAMCLTHRGKMTHRFLLFQGQGKLFLSCGIKMTLMKHAYYKKKDRCYCYVFN